jgi:hypothetical protein
LNFPLFLVAFFKTITWIWTQITFKKSYPQLLKWKLVMKVNIFFCVLYPFLAERITFLFIFWHSALVDIWLQSVECNMVSCAPKRKMKLSSLKILNWGVLFHCFWRLSLITFFSKMIKLPFFILLWYVTDFLKLWPNIVWC